MEKIKILEYTTASIVLHYLSEDVNREGYFRVIYFSDGGHEYTAKFSFFNPESRNAALADALEYMASAHRNEF